MADKASARPPSGAQRLKPNLQSPQAVAIITVRQEELDPWDLPEAEQNFNIHKAFLVHYAPYFADLLVGAQAERLTVDCINFVAFGHFVHWIYHQNLNLVEHAAKLFTLVKIWELGERFEIPALQNCAVDSIHAMSLDDLSSRNIGNWALSNMFQMAASAESPFLNSLLCDILITTKDHVAFSVLIKQAGLEVVQKVAVGMKDRQMDPAIRGLNPACDYYVSVTGPDI